MHKITDQDPISKSADILQENIQKLKSLFPEIITEGSEGTVVNVDVLKSLVGDAAVTDTDEKYGLIWHGKRKVRQLALTPSTGTLRPAPEDSVDWNTTKNLMIEGDNLEVLKLLQKSYAGKIKMIYIDPPYNTGKDFVYKDDFRDNISNYLEVTGQKEGDRKLSTNTESSGRYHTDWLNMMYPRLKLAHSLLKNDGVIVIHIDEHEYSNLETMLNEIFGEENNIGTIIWDKRNPKGEVTGVAQQHEYISIYCYNKRTFKEQNDLKRPKENAKYILKKAKKLIENAGGQVNAKVLDEFKAWIAGSNDLSGGEKAYNQIDELGQVFQSVSMAAPDRPETRSHRPLIHPKTNKSCPVPSKGWRYPDTTMDELLTANEIIFGENETTQPRRKYLLAENMYEKVPSLFYYGGSDERLLLEMEIPFDNPKPKEIAKRLIEPICSNNDLILDFFAGSGTAAHATWEVNNDFNKILNIILVQLPEQCSHNENDQKLAAKFCDTNGKPRNIAEITKERLRRAGNKIREEHPLFAGDLGFRVFKLDSTNILEWDINSENLEASLQMSIDHLKSDRSEDDILYEILLKLGLDLCVPMEKKEIGGKTVHSVGGGVLMACLDKQITREDVETLALGMIDWHEELAPEADTTVIFRDSAFKDDIAKTNLSAILEQYGIKNVRSL